MKPVYEVHHVRYPPFEASRWKPDSLPIVSKKIQLGEARNKTDAESLIDACGPSFRLGEKNGWLLKRTFLFGEQEIKHNEPHQRHEDERFVPLVKRQRTGWYLLPSPIHNILRQFINAVVVVLLLSLFYLFISPILLFLNIPVYGLNTVRWGLLDYPALAVFVVPLIFAPLFIRILANLVELQRQRQFLQNDPLGPNIEFVSESFADEPLRMNLKFPHWGDTWGQIDVMWRVGVLPPARETALEALERHPQRQPPPGFSTELPHHWEIGLDDGTAGGEDAPMEIQEVKGGLYLRPMRIMAQGGAQRWQEGETLSLDPPTPTWPGSVNSDLLRVHWECIVRITRTKGGPLLWVQPLKVGHPKAPVDLQELPLHDGRSELDISISTH